MPEQLPDVTRQQIEPQVRHALAQLTAARAAHQAGASPEVMAQHLYQIEFALGRMLPTIRGVLNVPVDSALLGKTFTLHAA